MWNKFVCWMLGHTPCNRLYDLYECRRCARNMTKEEAQAVCTHRGSSVGYSPMLSVYTKLFSGELSIEEYRQIPEMPTHISTCCDCGRVSYVPHDWKER